MMQNKLTIIPIFCIVNFILCSIPVRGQSTDDYVDEPAVTIKPNKTTEQPYYESRHFSKQKMDDFRQMKDFQYDEEKVQEEIRAAMEREQKRSGKSDSRRKRELDKKKKTKREQEPDRRSNIGSSANWTLILLIFAILVLVLLFVLGFKPDALFRKSNKNLTPTEILEKEEENIHTMQLETALEKAIRLQNYRLAVRILYLSILKKFEEKEYIEWKTNKTNWDYVRELKIELLKPEFRQITNTFDYIWYGNFSIDISTYKLIEDKMNTFKQRI